MILGHVIHGIFLPLDAFSGKSLVVILIRLPLRFVACIRDRGRVPWKRTTGGVGVGVGVGVVGVGENATVVTVGAPPVPYTRTNSSLVWPYEWFKVAVVS